MHGFGYKPLVHKEKQINIIVRIFQENLCKDLSNKKLLILILINLILLQLKYFEKHKRKKSHRKINLGKNKEESNNKDYMDML